MKIIAIFILTLSTVSCSSLYMKPEPCACYEGEQMKDINGAA